jgi:hypothetical protein
MSLTLVLRIDNKEGELITSVDSVEQGDLGIPASKQPNMQYVRQGEMALKGNVMISLENIKLLNY